jgi:hypothetical protein
MVANTGTLETPMNGAPYFDDYDPAKGFVRILFRPFMAVQGRELTQMQTILQAQISRFGSNIFKEGSIVSGGQFIIDDALLAVKIKDTNLAGTQQISVQNHVGQILTGVLSGVNAYVVSAADGTEAEVNKKTFFVKYLNSGSDFNSKTFRDNETLQSPVGINPITLAANSSAIGSSITVNEGVLFVKGFFAQCYTQTVIHDG